MLGLTAGDMTAYGLPKPDHKLLEAHPTVSAELLSRLGHGDIAVKPNIERFSGGRTVRFIDGSEEEIDLVVYCTGYKISFPFFEEGMVFAKDNRLPLYRRVASVEHPGLYFIGLIQPLGAIMPLAEAQSEWVADLLDGRGTLPSPAEMRERSPRPKRRCEALRRLQAAHDPGGLPALSAGDPAGAERLLSGCSGGEAGCPSRLLGFSPGAQRRSLSGLCEKQDAAAREGHRAFSSQNAAGHPHEVHGGGRGGAWVLGCGA